ncbi:MAG: hypothetical protein F4Y88_06320 [Chloroflexi bacterium]|nr:hypothetical protein [Chloroflexota bacterium]
MTSPLRVRPELVDEITQRRRVGRLRIFDEFGFSAEVVEVGQPIDKAVDAATLLHADHSARL